MQEFTLLTKTNLIKVLRLLPRLCIFVTGVVAVFLIGLFIYNLEYFDETLHSEVLALNQSRLSPPSRVPLAEDNIFYALMGFRTGADKNMTAVGIQLIDRYKENRAQGSDMLGFADYDDISGDKSAVNDNWRQTYDICTPLNDVNCLNTLSRRLIAVPVTDQRLTLLIDRYQRLQAMPSYYYPLEISRGSPVPAYQTLMNVSLIHLVNIYTESSRLEFLDQVNRDVQFWKLILRESVYLVDKMIAVTGIWQDILLVSEFMREGELTAQEVALITAIVQPLTLQEKDISEGYLSETRQSFRWLDEGMERPNNRVFSNWLAYRLTRTNAAKNAFYAVFTAPLIQLSQLSAVDFKAQMRNSFNVDYMQRRVLAGVRPDNFFNLGRKTLIAAVTCNNCEVFVARIHNLAGMMRMLELQLALQMEEAGNVPGGVEAFILGSDITDPYSGEAFNYNSLNRILSFDCIDWRSFSAQCQLKL